MALSESDTRAKLITPALRAAGWPEEWLEREVTPGAVILVGAGAQRGASRADYVLYVMHQGVKVKVAIVEAKSAGSRPTDGLDQAKRYARYHHVPFAYSTNGKRFVEFDFDSGRTSDPRPISQFPSWEELRDRWLVARKIDPTSAGATVLRVAPREQDRYYQIAAAQAVLEAHARGQKRMLLPLATGTGKTRIATSILKALHEARQLRKALFVCDRDELRRQALNELHKVFAVEAQAARADDPAKNARIVVATYQTLDVDRDGGGTYLEKNYAQNHFSHVIIDECHRSAWDRWSAVLSHNDAAVHIGLTATPRSYETISGSTSTADSEITANNLHYFGNPIYEYPIAQGIDDGFLANFSIVRSDVMTAGTLDREYGIERSDLTAASVAEVTTGESRSLEDLREQYHPGSIELDIELPERVQVMCADLFNQLAKAGDPRQKTIVFCQSVSHADRVANELNNQYATWLDQQIDQNDQSRMDVARGDYAFKCTYQSGRERLPDLRSNEARAFVATTVDLLSTGVDVPCLENLVFFRHVNSPIPFHQMLGRGTRIDEKSNKLHFTIYDYTNATRLLDVALQENQELGPDTASPQTQPGDRKSIYEVRGVKVEIFDNGKWVVDPAATDTLRMISMDDYRQTVTETILRTATTIYELRDQWVEPKSRANLVAELPHGESSLDILRHGLDMEPYDGFDVLGSTCFADAPRTRSERVDRFLETSEAPAEDDPSPVRAVLRAYGAQFGHAGTRGLEEPSTFDLPPIQEAGGFEALGGPDQASGLIREVKRMVFVVGSEWQDQRAVAPW